MDGTETEIGTPEVREVGADDHCPSEPKDEQHDPWVREEDTRDVRTILEPLKPTLMGILRRFRIPDADAADLLQDTLVDFVQKRRTVAIPEAWITFVLRRRCIDYARARDRRFWEAVDSVVLERLSTTESQAGNIRARADLEQALAKIQESSREVLRRRYVLGQSDREIAEALGYAENSIAALVRRAQKRLAKALLAVDPTYLDGSA